MATSIPQVTRTRAHALLTPRELQLITCMADGLQYKQAAFSMGLVAGTAKTYATHIIQKLRAAGYAVGNMTGVVALALRNGWIK